MKQTFQTVQVDINKIREDVQKVIKDAEQKFSLDAIKSMDYEMAIGQSGKGSVFGSVFITAVWWPCSIKSQIQRLRLDEKYVNQIQKGQQRKFRKDIFQLINIMKEKVIFYEWIQLSPSHLSSNMNNMLINYNLNELIFQGVDKICRVPFEKGFKVRRIFSKCFGQKSQQMDRIRQNLYEFKQIIKQINIQSKADGTCSLINMANLLARALNQRKLDEWKFNEQTYFDQKFGSGGTNDQVTVTWLKQNKHHIFGYPNIVRFSWKTVSNSLQNTLVMAVNENHEEQKIFKGINIATSNKNARQKDLWQTIPEKKNEFVLS